MKTIVAACAVVGAALLLQPVIAGAEHHSVQAMAKITMKLNHYPSDEDKKTLESITSSATASDAEKAVAKAIANIEHKVNDADRAELEAIADDESLPGDLRDLAYIVAELNHTASESAKAELAEIAGLE